MNHFPGSLQVCLFWLATLVILGVLQMVGAGAGFHVGPSGEDFIWTFLLGMDAPVSVQKAFWEHDLRNPLNPWFYLLAQPLISSSVSGLFLVRKLVDLLCGLAVYAAFRTVGGESYRGVATAAGFLAVVWNFSRIVGQTNWPMLAAAALGLLGVAAYVRFLDSERREAHWLWVSLLLYLVALGAYSLNASFALAVPALAVLRRREPMWLRWRLAALDFAPFAGLFGVFYLIWNTTGEVPASALPASLWACLSTAGKSIGYFLWDPVLFDLLREAWQSQSPLSLVLLTVGAVVLGGGAYLALRAFPPRVADKGGFVQLLAVAAAASLMIVVLESMMSLSYPVGGRSPTVQQIVVPLVLVVLIGWFPRVFPGLAAGLVTFGALVGFCYNVRQVRWMVDLDRISAGLKMAVPVIRQPTMFVLLEPTVSLSPWLSDLFVKSLYRSVDVNLKLLIPGPTPTNWREYPDLVFGTDAEGLLAESTIGFPRLILRSAGPSAVPYSQVVLLRPGPNGLTRTYSLTAEELKGYRAAFRRAEPLQLQAQSEPKVVPLESLSTWRLAGETTVGADGIRMAAMRASNLSLAETPIPIEPNGEYEVVLEASATGPAVGFYVDFYGLDYDRAAQDHLIQGLKRERREFRFRIPAGAKTPKAAVVRLVNPSTDSVTVHAVKVFHLD